MIIVNGEHIENVDNLMLLEFLEGKGYNTSRIAVELGGVIVPRAQYGQTMLNDGDRLEIVSFVGGG